MYIFNKTGPKIDPCGTPENIYFMYYLCVVIDLFSTGLYKSEFFTCLPVFLDAISKEFTTFT